MQLQPPPRAAIQRGQAWVPHGAVARSGHAAPQLDLTPVDSLVSTSGFNDSDEFLRELRPILVSTDGSCIAGISTQWDLGVGPSALGERWPFAQRG